MCVSFLPLRKVFNDLTFQSWVVSDLRNCIEQKKKQFFLRSLFIYFWIMVRFPKTHLFDDLHQPSSISLYFLKFRFKYIVLFSFISVCLVDFSSNNGNKYTLRCFPLATKYPKKNVIVYAKYMDKDRSDRHSSSNK